MHKLQLATSPTNGKITLAQIINNNFIWLVGKRLPETGASSASVAGNCVSLSFWSLK